MNDTTTVRLGWTTEELFTHTVEDLPSDLRRLSPEVKLAISAQVQRRLDRCRRNYEPRIDSLAKRIEELFGQNQVLTQALVDSVRFNETKVAA